MTEAAVSDVQPLENLAHHAKFYREIVKLILLVLRAGFDQIFREGLTMNETPELIDVTADIVSAFVGHNTVRATELPELIKAVHDTLTAMVAPKPVEEPAPALTPAVPIKRSVTDDYIVCLDDGLKFKSLKRHLAALGMTPEQYRAKWNLPASYPMVAPGYAAKRSELAKASGLGSSRVRPESIGAAVADEMPIDDAGESIEPPAAEPPPARRRRQAKAA